MSVAHSRAIRYVVTAWRLLRLPTYLLMGIYVMFAVSVAAFALDTSLRTVLDTHWYSIVVVTVAIGLWYISSTGVNDYADYEIDQINLADSKDRPAVQQLVTRGELLGVSIAAALVCLALLLTLQNLCVILLFLGVTLLQVTYSVKPFHISHRGVLAPLLLPIGYVILPVYGVLLVCDLAGNSTALLAMAGLYVHMFARILLKDFRDIVGDKKFGKKTALIQLGRQNVCLLAAIGFGASTLLLLSVLELWPVVYLLAIALGFGITMLRILSQLSTWKTQRVAIQLFGRIATMLICIVTFATAAKTEHMSDLRIQLAASGIAIIFVLSTNDIVRLMAGQKTKN